MDVIAELNAGLQGRYNIEREIGAGGMATVFLARDLRHDRRVALKVLKPELGAVVGAERFLSEIRVTANLQHPNLLPLFDSGEVDGLLFYVMPYVEGETLRRRLERERQLSIEEAVRIAVAICGALDYAHRQGVVHRDLKPENVLLHDGQPLIADFGIALAISNAGGARVTQTGISLGTPQYMAPEQATGDRVIDARADVYSAGALTYEMLAGEPPHTGATAQAVIAKLLTEEPRPLSAARRSVPAHVEAAVHRALEKLPADRFGAARELADALMGKVTIAGRRQSARSRSLIGWRIAAAVSGIVAAVAIAWPLTHRPSPASIHQLYVPLGLPDSAAFVSSDFTRSLALSADGLKVAYVGAKGLFVRWLADPTPRLLTPDAATDPKFSPDGEWVAYVSSGALRKVRVSGGASEPIVASVARYGWSSKGKIVFTRAGAPAPELWSVSENGGSAERLVHQARAIDRQYGEPSFFPDGEHFLLPVVRPDSETPQFAVGRLGIDSLRYLDLYGNHPLYLPGGVLLYVDAYLNVMAVSLDERSLAPQAKPKQVFHDVLTKGASAELSVALNGTMAYAPAGEAIPRQLIEMDRDGREHVLPHPAGALGAPRYSPDGRSIALAVIRMPAGAAREFDIWIYDRESPTARQLSTSHNAFVPDWTRDGRRVGWSELKVGLGGAAQDLRNRNTVWRSADGRDTATTLVKGAIVTAFSSKADLVVCVFVESDGHRTLNVVQLDSTHRRTVIGNVSTQPHPRVSPDGNWVAYVDKDESGRLQVYLSAMSASGDRTQISTTGGTDPVWNPQGRELFYRNGSRLVSVTLDPRSKPRIVRVDTLSFKVPYGPGATYDVSPDGQRFLVIKPAVVNDQPMLITGWLDSVRKLLTKP